MRQWNLDPKFLCAQHLLGEHYELHKAIGAIIHHKNIQTYIDRGLLFPADIPRRHEELVQEMLNRGMRHLTPLPAVRQMPTGGFIDEAANLLELKGRCPQCKARIEADTYIQKYEEIKDSILRSSGMPPETFGDKWKRKNVNKKSASG